ncbi:MAG: ABC transporter ATP-binding protein [Verrucomicrobia bacterium]|nr:ABC transporter ATP-binding protein [Verrucomicrobiota bacterium]
MLRLSDVKAYYLTRRAIVKAVDGVTLDVRGNEILGVAGESGCGKSTLLKILYDSLEPPLKLVAGKVEAEMKTVSGKTLKLGPGQIRHHWWRFISYIPQGSMSVLNPVVRVEKQFLDSISRRHRLTNKREIHERIANYLNELELPIEVLNSYPHQLSGGMRQRVLVALGTFLHPQIVLADEPTTALDVVIQKGILLMLAQVQEQMKNSLVIVSHDIGVHYQITHRIAIMYNGKIVEIGPTEMVFKKPLHPYAQMLIQSLPHVGDDKHRVGISGRPPSLIDPPLGCRFAARCPFVMDVCHKEMPSLMEVEPDRFVACYLHREPLQARKNVE